MWSEVNQMPKFKPVQVPRADVLDSGTELTLLLDLPGVVDTGVELVVEKQILKVRATPEGMEKVLEKPRHAVLVESLLQFMRGHSGFRMKSMLQLSMQTLLMVC